MDAPGDPEGPRPPGGDGRLAGARETARRLSRDQLFVLISTASLNLGSMMCYSILGPFFPQEAEKKGASNTVIGMIFGCYALFELVASLVFGKYLVHVGAKFMFVAGMFVSGGVTILFGESNRCNKLCGRNNRVIFCPRKGLSKSCGYSNGES